MTKDIEREAFEALPLARLALDQDWVRYSEDTNSYYPNEDFCPESAPEAMSFAWQSWQAAKAHEAKKLEGCVVVPESELKDTFYWPDSEYVVDCPFDYEFELDKGEIQVIEKWQRTKSTKIYFSNIYKDDESFEITEFKSLEEAQDAVKENNAYLESQEFFNLAEAARGGK